MVRKIRTLVAFTAIFIFVYLLLSQEKITIVRKQPVTYSISRELDESDIVSDSWNCINQSACIYSAYWDQRFTSPFVRLIAIVSKQVNISSWQCLLTYNDTLTTETSLKVENIPEGHNRNHNAVFMLCPAKRKPNKVELVAGQVRTPSITVRTIKFENNGKIAVCVRPFYGNFSNNNLIIAEFISYYQELGVDYFTFYDYESSRSLKQLIYELMADGYPITLLPWNLSKDFSESWSFGQMASIADCAYRNSRSYEFVAILDVDEFIVPKEDISLKDTIKRLKDGKWGTYMFRQTFFCMEYDDDPNSINITMPLVTQIKTKRERKVWPYFKRSKCVIRPAAVVAPGIHFSWIHLQSWNTLRVSGDVALLHHYRAKKCKISKGDYGVTEKRALRYGKRILQSSAIKIWRNM